MKVRAIYILMITAFCQFAVGQTQEAKHLVVYQVQPPDMVEPGKTFAVKVKLTTQPGWYVYAPTGNNAAQGMIETNVVFELPVGINRTGKLKIPQAHYKNGYEVLDGKDIIFTQVFKALATFRSGSHLLKGTLTWQSCSTSSCLPPVTEEFTTTLTVR